VGPRLTSSRLQPDSCRLLCCCCCWCPADNDIRNLPIPQLQAPGGFLFVWVINSKYQFTLDLFDKWGYT
jgi:hypothetical protein